MRSPFFPEFEALMKRMWLVPALLLPGLLSAQAGRVAGPATDPDLPGVVQPAELAGPALLDELFQTLVEPVVEYLPQGARVIVVPDGPLHYLNFEALPVPGDKPRYWIEDVRLGVAPALGILTAARAPARRPERVLVIGDAIEADPRYPRLKFASDEIAGIVSRWPAGESRDRSRG